MNEKNQPPAPIPEEAIEAMRVGLNAQGLADPVQGKQIEAIQEKEGRRLPPTKEQEAAEQELINKMMDNI